MTHPLTPREKVARTVYDTVTRFDGDTVGTHLGLSAMIDAAAPTVDDERRIVKSVCDDIADSVLIALASGSGDHAELERLAEAASGTEWQTYTSGRPEYKNVTHYIEQNPPRDLPFIAEVQEERDAAFVAAANPATVLALLAEIAALRGERDRNREEYLAERQSRMEHGSREAGYLDQIERLNFRATEEERKLAEAVGLLGEARGDLVATAEADTPEWSRRVYESSRADYEQDMDLPNRIGAFIASLSSKEAERG